MESGIRVPGFKLNQGERAQLSHLVLFESGRKFSGWGKGRGGRLNGGRSSSRMQYFFKLVQQEPKSRIKISKVEP